MPHIAYQQWDSGSGLAAGTHDGTMLVGDALVIDTPTSTLVHTDPFSEAPPTTYEVATWTSPEISPGFDYTELVASWNADAPDGTWLQVSVHGKTDDGSTSKDYVLGRWTAGDGPIHRTTVPAQDDDLASVVTDVLIAKKERSLSTWQLTLSLLREVGSSTTPSVTLISAMASALPTDAGPLAASPLGGAEGITLDVPAYSQELHIGEYPQYNNGGEAWCSATSTAMVLAFWGRGPTLDEYAWVDSACSDPWVVHAAANTYDHDYDGTGNWSFNTAYAARYGLKAFITRLRSLTEAEQFIKAGIPLIVSVSFRENELSGAGYDTDGHLMVLVGFTPEGDVVVNDPASHLVASNDEVRVVYDRTEFENVWLPAPHSGGIVYVVHPPDVPLPPAPSEPNW